jgi:molybdate transport system substrate-binding protein
MGKRTPAKGGLLLFIGILCGLTSCTPSPETESSKGASPSVSSSEPLLISAASSLTDAMNEIGIAFTKENPNISVRFNFAASGPLEQQIEQGAPVDVFASASLKEVDALDQKKLLEPNIRINFAGNKLVLVAAPDSSVKGWDDLKSSSVKKVALSNPDSVPSGRYAQETLIHRGLWSAVKPKAVFGENVRQTLTYVSGGNVDVGIVFATDAQTEKGKVKVISEAVVGTDHKPIVYPAVVLLHAPHREAAKKFTAFLQSSNAQAIFSRYGFVSAPATK